MSVSFPPTYSEFQTLSAIQLKHCSLSLVDENKKKIIPLRKGIDLPSADRMRIVNEYIKVKILAEIIEAYAVGLLHAANNLTAEIRAQIREVCEVSTMPRWMPVTIAMVPIYKPTPEGMVFGYHPQFNPKYRNQEEVSIVHYSDYGECLYASRVLPFFIESKFNIFYRRGLDNIRGLKGEGHCVLIITTHKSIIKNIELVHLIVSKYALANPNLPSPTRQLNYSIKKYFSDESCSIENKSWIWPLSPLNEWIQSIRNIVNMQKEKNAKQKAALQLGCCTTSK